MKKNITSGFVLAKLKSYMGKRKCFLDFAIFFSILSNLLGLLPYVCVWFIVRVFLAGGMQSINDRVSYYAWGAFIFAVLSMLLYLAALIFSHMAAFRVERNFRYRSTENLLKMPLGFFSASTVGKIRKIIDDNASITHSFTAHQLPDLVGGVVVFLSLVVFMFVFDWRMGLVCLVPLILAFSQFARMMGPRYAETMKTYMGHLEAMNAEAVEYVRGIPVVKVFQQTVYSFKRFYAAIMDYNTWAVKYSTSMCGPMLIYTVALHSFVFLLIPLSIGLIYWGNDWKEVVLNLVFYILITPFFEQCLMKLVFVVDGMRQAGEAVVRVENLIDKEKILKTIDEKPLKENYDIAIKDVSFRYEGTDSNALTHVDILIPQGKTVALVGASGSGKTTVARLIARFWDVSEGEITIGGINVKDIPPEKLMLHMSFVFQNTKLFKTSVRENVLYGNPDATEKELQRALQLAQCEELIAKLPAGIDTRIGTKGIYLSGGEQQRIALARAFLKDAPILLLDEATAFADPENEHEIQKALKELMDNKTVVMIAHRLSSVIDADEIVVIDQGRVLERGNHSSLMKKKGAYYQMWNEYQQSVRWIIGRK